jgi:hypothetical protein
MSSLPTVVIPEVNEAPALVQLISELRASHNDAINAVVIYGSCLRSGDIFDGLLDIYLICDSYREAYDSSLLALGNWLLPPNVFYTETEYDGHILRSKYAVISSADFDKFCSPARFESYIWGRFAQPVAVPWHRDQFSLDTLQHSLQQAVTTFLGCALPSIAGSGTVTDLWQDSLALSYNTELRSEGNNRAAQLAQLSASHFAAATELVAAKVSPPLRIHRKDGALCYESSVTNWQRRRSRLGWAWRGISGKLLSVLRLLKALFTFRGGLDYIAWKLERHSGEKIVIPDRVRRYPLVFLWGFFWQLYRRGIFK